MTSTNCIARTVATILLCLFAFASASFAATTSLNYPRGLALDSKGNLYVANYGGSEVLVYNPTYAQLAANDITQDVNAPVGLAFDPRGRLWVANYGNSSVTVYNSTGVELPGTLTNKISGPGAIAIDGLNNIWVQSNQAGITVYDEFNDVIKDVAPFPGFNILGLNTSDGYIAIGGNPICQFVRLGELLANDVYLGTAVHGVNQGVAIAADSKSNFYVADTTGSVVIVKPATGASTQFLSLSFAPAGMVVDNSRGRLYISDELDNQILVYSTKGVLMHTIK